MKKAVVFVMLLCSFAFALEDKNNNNAPILIEANKLKYDNKNAVAIYSGNVVVKQEDFTLWADKMYIYFSKNKEKKSQTSNIERIEAVGNVRFKKGEYFGSAKKAEYYEEGRFLKLVGNAKLENKGNIIEGDVITYYLDSQEAFVSGKNRVRTIIINENGGR